SGILEPKNEPEHADDDGERERAGHDVVGPGPHDRSLCSLSGARSSAIPFSIREPISKSSKKDYEAGRQSWRLEPPHNRFEKWGVDAKGRRAFLRIMRFRVPRGSRSVRRLVYHANIDQRANVTTSFVPGYRSLWPSCSRGPLHRRYSMCDLDCPRRSFELRRRMDSGVYIRKHLHGRIRW